MGGLKERPRIETSGVEHENDHNSRGKQKEPKEDEHDQDHELIRTRSQELGG